MNVRGHFFVLRAWTGQTKSEETPSFFFFHFRLRIQRIKEKLRSGELAVSGDQWPIFLYAGYTYDPEDPWNGLLRSTLLVCVSFCRNLLFLLSCR